MLDAYLLSETGRHTVEKQRRLPAPQVSHFEILPGDTVPPARADRLHAGFLGSEARGVAFVLVGLALHICDLRGRVDAPDEFLSVALDGCPYARDFRQIHAGADDHFSSLPVVVMVSLPCLTPFVEISISATFRTTALLPRTTRTSRQ